MLWAALNLSARALRIKFFAGLFKNAGNTFWYFRVFLGIPAENERAKPRYNILKTPACTARLVFDGVGIKILLNHQGYFEYYCIVELTKVESCELVDLFKTVNQRISVNEKLT